jgi:shikimate kinase
MKIFIIGMPLSGKTTISKEYSKKYNIEFLDLDSLIERDNLYFIEDIYQEFGIKTFRILEKKAFLNYINYDNNFIMACSEGIIEDKECVEILKKEKCIFLNTSYELLCKRFINNPRPIFNEFKLKDLYEKRINIYNDITNNVINTDEFNNINDIIDKINEVISFEKESNDN